MEGRKWATGGQLKSILPISGSGTVQKSQCRRPTNVRREKEEGRAKHRGSASQERITRSTKYMKRQFVPLPLLPPLLNPGETKGAKQMEEREWVGKNSEQADSKKDPPSPFWDPLGSGLGWGNGRSFELDLRLKFWFRLYWVFEYLKSHNYQNKTFLFCFCFLPENDQATERNKQRKLRAYVFKVVMVGKIQQFPVYSFWT